MIDILLATYNSEKYLADQLDSIFLQDCPNFKIIIRDGGSEDKTLEIIEKYKILYPSKVEFLGSYKSNALENFSELMTFSKGDLIMFSDHDDIWLPNKISLSILKYKELESQHSKDTPLMVFSDSIVVNEHLELINNSMFTFQHLNRQRCKLNNLLVQNIASGNTMLINKSLKKLSSPVPLQAVMHDHWITLVATVFGKISCLEEPTLKYRQHSNNIFGAKKYSLFKLLSKQNIKKRFYANVLQADIFLKIYKDKLSPYDQNLLKTFSSFSTMNYFLKRFYIIKYKFWKTGLLRNLGMLLII